MPKNRIGVSRCVLCYMADPRRRLPWIHGTLEEAKNLGFLGVKPALVESVLPSVMSAAAAAIVEPPAAIVEPSTATVGSSTSCRGLSKCPPCIQPFFAAEYSLTPAAFIVELC